jgi:hypothetical protein
VRLGPYLHFWHCPWRLLLKVNRQLLHIFSTYGLILNIFCHGIDKLLPLWITSSNPPYQTSQFPTFWSPLVHGIHQKPREHTERNSTEIQKSKAM